MNHRKTIGLAIFLLLGYSAVAQYNTPDKCISHIRDHGNGWAVTVPGWLIKLGGKVAQKGMEDEEGRMITELTKYIKKLRVVVSEDLPEEFDLDLTNLSHMMENKDYEPLVQVRDKEADVNLWVKTKGDIIRNLVVTVLGEDEAVMLNMKAKLPMQTLQDMQFFKDYKERELGITPIDDGHQSLHQR